MSVFDLLFLAAALSTAVSLMAAAITALAGRRKRAWTILRTWGAAAAVYAAADIISHATLPVEMLHVHDAQCSDDWCAVVESAGRAAPGAETYRVAMRIYSRARRVEQRERGLLVYLTDPAGHRYDSEPQAGDVPLDTLLGPGESAMVVRTFRVPAGAGRLDLRIVHQGGFSIGALIIGRGPFDRTVVRLE